MLQNVTKVIVFIMLTGLLGSFWYLRTAYFTGNPVYPLTLMWQNEVVFQGVPDDVYRSDRFPGHHIPADIKQSLEDNKWLTIYEGFKDPWQTMDEDVKIGGYGAVLGVVGLPCLLFTIGLFSLRRRWDVLYFIACFILSYALFPFPTWSRFALPHLIPIVIAVGCTLEWTSSQRESCKP